MTSTALEWLAVATGLLCVWLNGKENVWGWVWGLASAGLYTFIFWDAKLFADAALQQAFVVSSLYGIWVWSRGGTQKAQHPIQNTPRATAWLLAVGGCAIALLLGYGLAMYTADPRPWIDASLTVGSLVAQYQLARKYRENWLVWIAVDAVYVFLYIDQHLYPTAFLYGAYLGLAIWGYRRWQVAPQLTINN